MWVIPWKVRNLNLTVKHLEGKILVLDCCLIFFFSLQHNSASYFNQKAYETIPPESQSCGLDFWPFNYSICPNKWNSLSWQSRPDPGQSGLLLDWLPTGMCALTLIIYLAHTRVCQRRSENRSVLKYADGSVIFSQLQDKEPWLSPRWFC